MSRAREAFARTVEEHSMDIARTGLGTVLSQSLGAVAHLVRRDTEEDDRAARSLIAMQPVVDTLPMLQEGVMLEWFDLMLKAEAMDRLLYRPEEERPGTGGRNGAEARWVVLDEIADWPENGPVVRDGQTRGRTA